MRPPIATPDRVPFIGLTGGIGAGKSTALAALEELGCSTLSADSVVAEIQASPEVIEALSTRFGDAIVADGRLDRQALARAAFRTDEDRAWLEGLIWPRVGLRIAEWREQQDQAEPRPRAAVVEVPLLFESGMESLFDSTIAVTVDEQVREARARSRGHAAVDERTARQLSQVEKAERATVAVSNDGTPDALKASLSSCLGSIGV